MPRNRYTKLNRKSQRAQIARQEKELAAPAKELHCKDVEPTTRPTVLPFVDGAKEHRRARLEQKRRHKPEHAGPPSTTQPQPNWLRPRSEINSTDRRRPLSKSSHTKAHHTSSSVSTRSPRRFGQVQLLVLGMVAAGTVLAGCGAEQSPHGELADNQRILTSCDPAAPPASLVEIDGTGSSASDAITAERMAAIESIVRRTAVCSGHLRVIVFSSSSAATTVLFDGPLRQHGATENARLKRVPGAIADAMAQVRSGYDAAVQALPQGGSDITAQYRLAAEWTGQLADPYRLHLYVLTDGFQTIGVDLYARALSTPEASALADQVTVPKLPGASVVVAGLGRVAEGTPPSSVVEGLVAYYDALCRKTTAAECVSVTDYTTEGR